VPNTANDQDAQQDRYQHPQDEQAADAKLRIAGRWQEHQLLQEPVTGLSVTASGSPPSDAPVSNTRMTR